MKTCPYCGNQNSDDSLFCTECGKSFPQGAVCPHCGAGISDDDAFCQNCGKKIAEDPMPTSTEPPHDADASNDDVEVQINETDETEELNYSVEDETRSWRDKILYILGAIVIVGVLGVCLWNYYSSSQRAERNIALEKVRQDSIEHVKQMERAKQDSIYKVQQEEKEFLQKFYIKVDILSWEELEIYVRKNITKNALQELLDGYDYECSDENCLALWMFSYEAGGDCDKLIDRKIEQESENTFLVTNTWGYEHDSSFKTNYKVRLGIIKSEGSYKIDSIEKVYSEEKQQNNESETDDLSWLQGHWIYEEGNYKSHLEISGNTIKTYSNMNSSPEIATFTIDGDELIAKAKGMATVVKIDLKNHRLDWGDGHWMHKVSSSSSQSYSNTTSSSNSQQRQRPFTDGQDIMARLYNQRFRHSSGLEIRIDGYGRIEIDGDAAGVLSVLQYNSESALLRYGNGMYGEGKILLKINGDKLLLQDTADGSVFYQR